MSSTSDEREVNVNRPADQQQERAPADHPAEEQREVVNIEEEIDIEEIVRQRTEELQATRNREFREYRKAIQDQGDHVRAVNRTNEQLRAELIAARGSTFTAAILSGATTTPGRYSTSPATPSISLAPPRAASTSASFASPTVTFNLN